MYSNTLNELFELRRPDRTTTGDRDDFFSAHIVSDHEAFFDVGLDPRTICGVE